MIEIVITGTRTGRKALLYEQIGRRGRKTYVATYHAYGLAHGRQLAFHVTRDSSSVIFGTNPACTECPASVVPYHGHVREDGPAGFRIQLHDAGCARNYVLTGAEGVVREHIQIHVGAAAAHGCIMVAGRRREYQRVFVAWMRAALQHTKDIRITVLPR